MVTSTSSSSSSTTVMGSRSELIGSQHFNQQRPEMGSGGDSESVWSSMLRSIPSTPTEKMQSGRRVVVLGPPSSGKTTLIAKLQGVDNPKKGCGLEYSYTEIRDEYRDDSSHLSIYVLDGSPEHAPLLKFAVNESSLESTLILITVSYESPSSILDQLKKWLGILHDHLDSMNLEHERRQELRKASVKRWFEYAEPGEEVDVLGKSVGTPTQANAEELISLPPGVLTRNLGLELVVVVTKSDHLTTTLERQQNYTDEHFDYIQLHIRQLCLQYGASLFYTSVKEEKNCDLLYKYLVHRLYGLPFRTPALVVEKDALFIPSGWDNEKKCGILQEGITSFGHGEEEWWRVLGQQGQEGGRKSASNQQRPVAEMELEVEDEQSFLERQLQSLHSLSSRGSSPMVKAGQRQSTGAATPGGTPKKDTTPSSATAGSQERVLANFFNSLLSKRSPNASAAGKAEPSSTPDSSRSDVAAELDSMLSNKSSTDC